MEHQQSPNQPTQPVQKPSVTPKPVFPWKITTPIIIVIALSVGITLFLVKGSFAPFLSQTKPTPPVSITSKPSVAETGTNDWKTYTDEKAGFSLQYPPDVILNGESKDATQNILWISSEPIDQIKDQPIYGGKAEAIKDKEALAKGELNGAGFATDVQIINLGKLNGKESTTLAQFEVCSVMFYKSLTFYPNNYRVMIGFSGVKEQIVAEMPDYFKIDKANCGDQKIWNLDKTQAFLQALKDNQGGKSAQNWYDTFDAIIKTVTLTKPAVSSENTLPTNTSACDVSDATFCTVIADLKKAVKTPNYAGFLSYHNLQSVTCDPDGMFMAICEGEAKGVVKQGYGIGYYQSEGAVATKESYINSVSAYVETNGSFAYHGSLISADKGIAVFLNAKKDHILSFPMKRTESGWRMDYLLLGKGDATYTDLSSSILDY